MLHGNQSFFNFKGRPNIYGCLDQEEGSLKKKLPRNLQAYFVANIFEANKLILNKSKP